jgi:peptide chain release factor 1
MDKKIELLLSRLREVEEALFSPEITSDKKKYRELTQEHAFLSSVKDAWEKQQKCITEISQNQALLKTEKDPEFVQILQEDIAKLEAELQAVTAKLEHLIVPPGPHDHANTILELRAGTGGDEAGLFVADCVRMYHLFADHMGWKYDLLSATPSDLGGVKEYVMVLSGTNVYRYLQHEAGTHRVQRVPETEAQGRVHTSTITVACYIEPEEDETVVINEADLRIETTRSSGAGGQHVNKTDSAVRLTHLPTGIVVFCQEERSQHKNKDKAMRYLRAKIAEEERRKKKEAIDSKRAQQVGTGERSEKIRTYNFPQNRLTDHRINLTKYNLDRIMNGDLEEICLKLVQHFQENNELANCEMS